MLFIQEFLARVNVGAEAKITPLLDRCPEVADEEILGIVKDPVLLALVAAAFSHWDELNKKWSQKPEDESDAPARYADQAVSELESKIMFYELEKAFGGFDSPGVGLRRRGDELVLVKMPPEDPFEAMLGGAIGNAMALDGDCGDPNCQDCAKRFRGK